MTTLALKYRPRLLADLVGQEASVRALANALKRAKEAGGTIHHQAFLFAGVRGTGKTSTARILARALNCAEGPTATPCGTCDSCSAAEQPDRNLDIVEIDAASRASVEDARALRDQVQVKPAFCRYRVFIIDEVHMYSKAAFDALLKVMEEPPPHAVFVLATTELQDVPDTIKSRVQIFPFRLIPVGLIEGRLRAVCEAEGVSFDEGSLRIVAEAGQGSMRDALTTLDRVIAAGEGHVREDLVREQLGIVPAVRVQSVLTAVLQGDAGAILDECGALASLGTEWVSFWRELMVAFRDHLEAEVRRGAAPHEVMRLARAMHLLLSRERDLRDASLPRTLVELALVTAAQLPHLAPLDALARAGSAPPTRPPSGGSPRPFEPTPSSPRAAAPAPIAAPPAPPAPEVGALAHPKDPAALRAGLSEAIRSVPQLPRTLAALPHMASDLQFDGHVLHWTFDAAVRNTAMALEQELANPHLLSALRRLLPGLQRLALTFSTHAERPEDVLKADPEFQALLQAIQGEVVEVWREEPSVPRSDTRG